MRRDIDSITIDHTRGPIPRKAAAVLNNSHPICAAHLMCKSARRIMIKQGRENIPAGLQ